MLSSVLRYSAFVAVALAVLLVAVGMGAGAAVVVDWQDGVGRSASTGTPEGGKTEATKAAEDQDGAENPGGSGPGASFVHRATDENSRGDYTVVSDPSLNDHPNAVIIATPTPQGGTAEAASYERNIGVWFAGSAHRWAIFNQNRSPIPAGTAFEVVLAEDATGFTHRAGTLNTAGNYTYLDDPLTNGKPDATLSVTQNWNPGGGRGVYNDHPVGVEYDPEVEKWAVYNRDGKTIPEGAAFNVAVSASSEQPPK
jgi:hypothetical protein